MQLGINWVALALFGAALVVAQIRSIPVRWRYFALAAANGVIGGLMLRAGGHPFNRGVGMLAVAFAVYYGVKGLRSHGR